MDISTPYYEDLSRISNSNIGWFLNKGPAFLHKMLTNPPPEEKNPVLERGTMIHMYILQPEEFQNTYVVWDKQKPTSSQQEKFCKSLADSVEIEPDKQLLSAYKAAYSTTNKSDAKMLSEAKEIASTLKEYIDFLSEKSGKTMISPWDYQMLKKIEYEILEHKLARNLIWTPEKIEHFHEFHINWEWGNVSCKSLLDGLNLDFFVKKATIYDLKTTQKLWHFEDSIDQYDYCRQIAYYKQAVMWYLKNECEEDPTEWTFEYYIIGIDTTGSNEIRVFKIEEYMVEARAYVISDALNEIAWHQESNKWEHSREYYEGDGSETLNL